MEIKTITTDAKDIAILCAKIADNKKAEDIKIFDVANTTSIADFFVICSGSNGRQLQSIADDIKQALPVRGIHGIGIEGYTDATWILMDYGNVIVHLFDREKRSFYDLDILWGDAPKIHW
ncbi:MAG TPA: ribosome silencing factor [Candidatus Brocadiaceae bacterium]|nr:ribosome silencing factor [Candidatus Brocadiaceae bacterium]